MGDEKMCEKIRSMLDDYVDDLLTPEEIEFMKAHAEKCERCAEEIRLSDIIKNELKGMDDHVIVPLQAQAAWRNAVKKEIRNKKFKKAYKALSSVAAALIVLVGATFALRSNDLLPKDTADEYNYTSSLAVVTVSAAEDDIAAYGMPDEMIRTRSTANERFVIEADGEADDMIVGDLESENIIKSCDIVLESDSVESDIQSIYDLTEEYEGYVSEDIRNYSESGDHADIVSRIPVDLMDDYISAAENIGCTVSISRFSQNADEIYYDIDSRLESKRLLADEMSARIKDADEETLLLMNEEISKVYAEIDTLTRLANTRDNDLMYAKVRITLLGSKSEIVTPSESTLADRSAQGFKASFSAISDFLKDMVVSLAVIAPAAILIGVVALIVLFTVKSVKKNKNDKKEDGDE
ncbi:MAG: DUF4349 domain-containing protein [Clostridia bacterium]|nr:DUF4349 domain-containing protein [Clostridia bacterium]